MNLEDLKQEIVSHLAEMSNLRVGEPVENQIGGNWNWQTQAYDDGELETFWTIYEDENKASTSEWIEKEADSNALGRVILRGTRLYFEPGFKPSGTEPLERKGEEMFLSDLVAPDSFEEAVKVLSHALKVLNVCKPPKGVGLFGSMTPPGMPPFPGFGR